jgi:hypothetical protein
MPNWFGEKSGVDVDDFENARKNIRSSHLISIVPACLSHAGGELALTVAPARPVLPAGY